MAHKFYHLIILMQISKVLEQLNSTLSKRDEELSEWIKKYNIRAVRGDEATPVSEGNSNKQSSAGVLV